MRLKVDARPAGALCCVEPVTGAGLPFDGGLLQFRRSVVGELEHAILDEGMPFDDELVRNRIERGLNDPGHVGA